MKKNTNNDDGKMNASHSFPIFKTLKVFLSINACWSWLMKYANYLADSFLSLNCEIHLKFKPSF